MKKIAVIGTHGVGKTTLCDYLSSYTKSLGKKVACVGEVVRDCPYPINQGMCYKAAEWTVFSQVLRERKEERENPDLIICDRSFFDPMIYLDMAKKVYDEGEVHLHRGLRGFASNFLFCYDTIYLVQPSKRPIDSDGFRDTNKEFQEKIHDWFSEELDEMLDDYYMTMEEVGEAFKYDKLVVINSDEIFASPIDICMRIYKKCFSQLGH